MNNKKISTSIGTIVLIIIAVTVFGVLWKYVETQKTEEVGNQNLIVKPKVAKSDEKGENFPSVAEQSGVSLEETIKQAIFIKFPNWKFNNYTISVTVEISENNFAIGRFVYDNNKQDRYHNSAEEIWFAAKSNNSWTLVATSAVGYWGACQDFEKFNFPKDLTPDCWDIENNILIDTTNPKRFYTDGFTKEDKTKLEQAFVSYIKNNETVASHYLNKDLSVMVNRNIKNFVNGTILINGQKNISTGYFLAFKNNNQWKVVYDGQDDPFCSVIESYNFPSEIVDECYDELQKKTRKNL